MANINTYQAPLSIPVGAFGFLDLSTLLYRLGDNKLVAQLERASVADAWNARHALLGDSTNLGHDLHLAAKGVRVSRYTVGRCAHEPDRGNPLVATP